MCLLLFFCLYHSNTKRFHDWHEKFGQKNNAKAETFALHFKKSTLLLCLVFK